MLELPEIETLRRDLERETAGKKVKSVEIKVMKAMPTHRTKKSVTDVLTGAKIVTAERHGLSLVAQLDNEHALVLRLAVTGRLERLASKEPVREGTQVIITFTQGGDLRLVDPEGVSTMGLVSSDDLESYLADTGEIGLDLLARPISWVLFERYMKAQEGPLKTVLTDPAVFVGIGAVYSDEILFDAGLRFDRPANELSTQELRRLNRSIVGILYEAIKYRGVSLEDRPFVDLSGEPGDYGDQLAVYGKAGELSPRSRTPIEVTTFNGIPTYFCTTQV